MKTKRHFGLHCYPFPKDAKEKTFYDKGPSYQRFNRIFQYLVHDPGLAILTSDVGVGKTSAIRNVCSKLPHPDYKVIYLCDTSGGTTDLYRSMAIELGLNPSHRRSILWHDIKKHLLQLVDEKATHPIVVIDEAQHLSDSFFYDLGGFLNFSFDSRDLFTLWLVGVPALTRRLHQVQHAALMTRVVSEVRLEPLDHDTFVQALDFAFKNAGANQKIVSDQAAEMLYRASHGTLRIASKLLRSSLRLAQERSQNFVDDSIIQLALDEMSAL